MNKFRSMMNCNYIYLNKVKYFLRLAKLAHMRGDVPSREIYRIKAIWAKNKADRYFREAVNASS